ncbi:MAG TPA: tyrosine-type recombinase/integrase [Candidatus Thermoplasmatota archaeon]|nr:tyrosine-type recombinase/integrase [Candidatus Thermoplasmatota archaeon]
MSERLVNGTNPKTVLTQLRALSDLALALENRPLDGASREDMAAVLSQRSYVRPYRFGARPTRIGQNTLAERSRVIKNFYRWLGKPEAVEWLKVRRTRRPRAQSTDILTKEEVERLLNAARTSRDRALLAVLIESGFRESEVCALRVGDLSPMEGGFRATLPEADGLKTGRRWVPLYDCIKHVQAWLQEHPARPWSEDEKTRGRWFKAPLFCGWDAEDRLQPRSVYDVVTRTGRRAKLRKHVYPHLLRFGAATHDAKRGMPPAAMNRKFGWSEVSVHALYYARLAAQDVEEWERRQRGLDGTKAPESPLAGPTCRRCELLNRAGALFCERCARPLTAEGEREAEERRILDLQAVVAAEVRRLMATSAASGRIDI